MKNEANDQNKVNWKTYGNENVILTCIYSKDANIKDARISSEEKSAAFGSKTDPAAVCIGINCLGQSHMYFSNSEAEYEPALEFQMHSLPTPPRAVNQLRISHNPGASEYPKGTFQPLRYSNDR